MSIQLIDQVPLRRPLSLSQEKRAERETPVFKEIQSIFTDVGIIPNEFLLNYLNGSSGEIPLSGGAISLGFGKLAKNIVTYPTQNIERILLLSGKNVVYGSLVDMVYRKFFEDGNSPFETPPDFYFENFFNELYEDMMKRLATIELFHLKYTINVEIFKMLQSLDPNSNLLQDLPYFDLKRSYQWECCRNADLYMWEALTKGFNYTVYHKDGRPYFFQKRPSRIPKELGDHNNATAISLIPLNINSTYIPAGMLVGIKHKRGITPWGEGLILQVNDIDGIFPLRPSIFSVPPEESDITFPSQADHFLYHTKLNKIPPIATFINQAEMLLE